MITSGVDINLPPALASPLRHQTQPSHFYHDARGPKAQQWPQMVSKEPPLTPKGSLIIKSYTGCGLWCKTSILFFPNCFQLFLASRPSKFRCVFFLPTSNADVSPPLSPSARPHSPLSARSTKRSATRPRRIRLVAFLSRSPGEHQAVCTFRRATSQHHLGDE